MSSSTKSHSSDHREAPRSEVAFCVDDANRRIEALLAQLDTVTRQKKHVEEVLEGVLASRSWKITKPIRWLTAVARALTPIYRNRRVRFDMSGGSHVVIEGERVKVVGPSATVRLSPSGGATLPTGWVVIRGRVTAPRSPLFFLIYFRTGEGFDGSQRLWVPLSSEGTEATLAYLPPTTKELRLDPFEDKIEFSLHGLEIREIGKAQRVAHVVRALTKGCAANPQLFLRKAAKALAVVREGGLTALRARLFSQDQFTYNYQEWVKRYDTLSEEDKRSISEHGEALPYRPLISVVMPVYNSPERWLRAAIESVRRQLYTNWELCIADDNSSDPHVRVVLEDFAAKDSRIKVVFRGENGHISKASNSAAELASGEFIALLDHDDELTDHALYMVACELNRSSALDLIYSDEDKVTSYGMRFNPYFKSGWNPDLLCSQNYVCHLTVVRTSLFRRLGGFREGFDGAQDWDLVLRIADATSLDRIGHIPHILYHWRVIEGSTAQSTAAKPYVMAAQKRAVEEHLQRRGFKSANVEILDAISQLRVHHSVPTPEPRVSVVIPTKDQLPLLSQCVEGVLEKTAYKNLQLIIVDNGSVEPETREYLGRLAADPRVVVLRDTRPFNYSRLNNEAVVHADGELLAFLNNDLEVTDGNWLREMVSHAIRPEVGAVGARLLYPNRLLQHAGVITGIGGVAGHNHKGRPYHDPGYFNRAILCQNLSAVTAACMVMRKATFLEVGGFEEGALSVAFNDVDLCLKVRSKGYLVVYTPYAELVHHESASRGYETTPEKFARFEGEVETMKKRWGIDLSRDPYYNPNLTLLSEDFAFAFPPRVEKPWRAGRTGKLAKAA